MEHWQAIKYTIRVSQINDRATLTDIGQEILVRELHSLGHALGAAGEKNKGGVGKGRILPGPGIEFVVQQGRELASTRNLFPNVLQVNQLNLSLLEWLHLKLRFLQEFTRGDDLFQIRQPGAGKHHGCASGVV